MENLRLSAVVDRVVAWHNRHPLARRIGAAQVHAIGYVALPFTADAPPPAALRPTEAAAQAIAEAAALPLPELTELAHAAAAEASSAGEGSRLRERALTRARERGPGAQAADAAAALLATLGPATLQPDFSEDFIDPLSPRQVARFAQRHGRVLAHVPVDGPVREVLAHPPARLRGTGRMAVRVYLLTAVIETDTRKSRVLLGLGQAVLGRRIRSGPRLAALLAMGTALVATPLWLMRPASPAAGGALVLPAATGAAAAVAASAPVPATATATATAPAAQALMPAGLSSAEAAASAAAALPAPPAPSAEPAAPADTGLPPQEAEPPTRRRAVNLVPMLSEAEKAQARAERRALMEAAQPPAPTPAPANPPPQPLAQPPMQPLTQRAQPPSPTQAAALATSGPVFAISTRALRTRAEAEQVQVAMQSLLGANGPGDVRVEVIAQGDDWRVVAMPYTRGADAERGRALLASRGMRVKVVDF